MFTYDECKRFLLKNRICGIEKYRQACRKCDKLPKNPFEYYSKEKQWKGWGDFLNKSLGGIISRPLEQRLAAYRAKKKSMVRLMNDGAYIVSYYDDEQKFIQSIKKEDRDRRIILGPKDSLFFAITGKILGFDTPEFANGEFFNGFFHI